MTDFPPPDPETILGTNPPPQQPQPLSPPTELSVAGSNPGPDGLNDDRQLLASPTRQAPLAVVFIAWRFIRNLGLANLGIGVVFLVSGRLPLALLSFAAIAACVGLVFMVLAWWRFVFLIEADELLVRKGVLSQERLTIPLDRIQSVSIDQKLLHRPVGLVSVSVDTAGSSLAELQIDAVDRGKAEALQRLGAGRREPASPADGETVPGHGPPHGAGVGGGVDPVGDESVLAKRTLPDLVRIGVTAWPWTGLVVLASLATVGNQLGDVVPLEVDRDTVLDDRFAVEFSPAVVGYAVLFLVVLLLLVTILGAVLQVAREIVTNWDLQLMRTSTGLRRTAGLLNKTSKASTISRIQGLQTDRTPAEGFVGITKVTLPTIGDGDINLPGATEDELGTLREILFGHRVAPSFDRGISPLYIFLAVRNAVVGVTIVVAAGGIVLGSWWVLLGYLIVPLRWLEARRRWRLRRWSMADHRLAESYQFVNAHTAELDLVKTQTASVSQSFFERRRGLATVRVETAEGFLAVPLIPLAEATEVRDVALYAAESSTKAWM